MTDDPREIAEGLTEAQRAAMWPHPRGKDVVGYSCRNKTRDALEKKGLVEPGMWSLTPLGLQVRTLLQGDRS